MRNRLSLTLAGLILGTLTGCGDSGGPATVPSNPAPAPTAKVTKSPSPGAGDGLKRRD